MSKRKYISDKSKQGWDLFLSWLLKNPVVNSIVLFLILVIIVSGAICFFILIGAVTFPTEEEKKIWLEVNFQLLNAIFTLACLVDQPFRLTGIFMVSRIVSLQNRLKRSQSSGTQVDKEDKRLKRLEEHFDSFRTEFPWYVPESLEHLDRPEVSPDGAQTSDDIPPALDEIGEIDMHDLINANMTPFLLAMISFNVSTIGQALCCVGMWGFYDSTTRPPYYIAIGLPLSFVTSFAGMIFMAREKVKRKRSRKPTELSTADPEAPQAVDTQVA
ncbi:hypothetical protein MP638_002980 [Amoeboaphelidium occidentale]|nr:hypothetical protein MP638_002980 [Amoeboaphelidium occidentale]